MPYPKRTILERFWRMVTPEPNSGCWLWLGAGSEDGYGHFHMQDLNLVMAHRAAWMLLVGPIPDGLQLDHLCRVRCCVNPAHLEPVTPKVNLERAWWPKGRGGSEKWETCLRGHPLSGIRRAKGSQRRACRECARRLMREYRERKRLAAPAEMM